MKYRNRPCQIGNEKYRSQREAKRHQDLLLLEKAGRISSLRREVPFELARGVRFSSAKRATPPLRYVADFTYVKDGEYTVEDSKGMRTPLYKAKRHLMLAIHGIEVKEV